MAPFKRKVGLERWLSSWVRFLGSCRRLRFSSQHLHQATHNICNSSSGDLTSSSGSCTHAHTHKYGHKSLEKKYFSSDSTDMPCESPCVGQCWCLGPREPWVLKDVLLPPQVWGLRQGLVLKAPWLDTANELLLHRGWYLNQPVLVWHFLLRFY